MATINKTEKFAFTGPRVAGFKCPADKAQAFLWDLTTATLGLRATPAGKPSYVFQSVFQGKSIRITIGSPEVWDVPKAREKARELQCQIDEGRDPRAIKADKTAADVAKREDSKRITATVNEAWLMYLAERKQHWGVLHYRDHEKVAQAGGEQRQRMAGVKTVAGPLYCFMKMRLSDVTNEVVLAWAEKEGKARPTRTRLALRILKAFLRWASAEKEFKALADATAASGKKTREMAGKSKPKQNDNLQREQLANWFTHVRQIQNPIISAYLQCLLLTGARREELAELKWEDVNFQWRGMSMKDKIEGSREVPLTPYVMHLMASLPKRNQWVFSSMKAIKTDDKNTARRARYHEQQGSAAPKGGISTSSESGRLVEPSIAHRNACAAAGIKVTLHGLRRSFASLCEWLDIPGGVSAQIQGHKPQGVREQNYIRRPLDLLRVHHEKIEAWMLEQAGVTFVADVVPGKLRVVG